MKGNGKVYTLQEASNITGLKVQTLRMRIKSGKVEAFKNPSKHGEAWLIKAHCLKEIEKIDNRGLKPQESSNLNPSNLNPSSLKGESQEPVIEAYKEHITTLKGTLQNFEGLLNTFQQRIINLEAENTGLQHKIKLLPAPPETVNTILQNKEHALLEAQEAISRLEAELRQERNLPWWKKMFGKR